MNQNFEDQILNLENPDLRLTRQDPEQTTTNCNSSEQKTKKKTQKRNKQNKQR